MELAESVELFIRKGKHLRDLEQILLKCFASDGEVGLSYVIRLAGFYEDDVLPEHKWNIKWASALASVFWGAAGLRALAELPRQDNRIGNISTVMRLLSYAATSSLIFFEPTLQFTVPQLWTQLDLSSNEFRRKEFIQTAQSELVNLILDLPIGQAIDFDLVHTLYMLGLGTLHSNDNRPNYPLNSFFTALNTRWLRYNEESITGFMEKIEDQNVSEEEIHKFLEGHPYILEPYHAKIWSKVRLGEGLVADFVVRTMDDNYLVIELEKPSDTILTQNGNLSAKTTHAIRQALEYRDWLIYNHLYAKQNFPGIWHPECIVVLGRESQLSPAQKLRLRQENDSRRGTLRIVGYDWLVDRTHSVMSNLIHHNLSTIFNTD